MKKIKDMIALTFNSVNNHLNNSLNFCYELYGFDFMIDSDFQVWLIEVNTNPCLEESGSLLKKLIPRMIGNYYDINNQAAC